MQVSLLSSKAEPIKVLSFIEDNNYMKIERQKKCSSNGIVFLIHSSQKYVNDTGLHANAYNMKRD